MLKQKMYEIIQVALMVPIILFFSMMMFPAGTILMAVSCHESKIDGWDWVGSVVVPGYGLLQAIFC